MLMVVVMVMFANHDHHLLVHVISIYLASNIRHGFGNTPKQIDEKVRIVQGETVLTAQIPLSIIALPKCISHDFTEESNYN